MKNNRGFTLIELLAVIIILGILMIIAIPSVTEYISNSRKEAYVLSVKEIANGVSQKVNSGEYPFFDKDVTYYIPFDCAETENNNASPFGKWKDAYILVNYNGDGYDYYFTGYDEVGYGTTDIVPIKTLDKDLINPGQNNLNNKRGVARDNIGIIDRNSCVAKNLETHVAQDKVNFDGTEMGKDLLKDVVQIGDYVMYDAGTWEETKAMPGTTEYNTFGGYTKGSNRNESLNCTGDGKFYDGWRVLGVEGDSIILIHAGTPECFRSSPSNGSQSLATLKSNNWNKYVDSRYAISSQSIDFDTISRLLYDGEEEFGYLDTFSSNVLEGEYFFADLMYSALTYYSFYSLTGVYSGYRIEYGFSNGLSGVRPIVKLKSGVFANGKVEDANGNPAWVIGIK